MSRTRVARGEVPIVGQECCTEPHFTNQIARSLGLPELQPLPDETDRKFLIRRLHQLRWTSRHWATADLGLLSPHMLALAAEQICNIAADYAQNRAAERALKDGMFPPDPPYNPWTPRPRK